MSVIADYLIVADHDGQEVMDVVNQLLYEVDDGRRQQFRPINTDNAGGS